MPKFVVVYRDRHTLWEREVFDFFKLWYAAEFAVSTKLLHSGESRGSMSAALHPGKYAMEHYGRLRAPLFVAPTVAIEGSDLPDGT
jgi:hypothetical protein